MFQQVFISYRLESPEHARAVRRLGELLRQAKIPVALDKFISTTARAGPMWVGPNGVRTARMNPPVC